MLKSMLFLLNVLLVHQTMVWINRPDLRTMKKQNHPFPSHGEPAWGEKQHLWQFQLLPLGLPLELASFEVRNRMTHLSTAMPLLVASCSMCIILPVLSCPIILFQSYLRWAVWLVSTEQCGATFFLVERVESFEQHFGIDLSFGLSSSGATLWFRLEGKVRKVRNAQYERRAVGIFGHIVSCVHQSCETSFLGLWS